MIFPPRLRCFACELRCPGSWVAFLPPCRLSSWAWLWWGLLLLFPTGIWQSLDWFLWPVEVARPFAISPFIPGEGGDVPAGASVPVSPAQVASQTLAGMEKNGCIYGRKGFYASGVSSILSYSSLNSKYLCLKPFTLLSVGLQPDVGPWRTMCLPKCEVLQTARHQIISEGEMFDCYFSLLRLLWFGFNCGSFNLPFGCPFCSSACSVAEPCLSNFFCGPPHDGEGCRSLCTDALARLRISFSLLVF